MNGGPGAQAQPLEPANTPVAAPAEATPSPAEPTEAPPTPAEPADVADEEAPAAPPRAVQLDKKDKGGACGDEGQPACPLEGWMEKNTTPAVENQDLKALAAALHKIEFMAPDPKWDEGASGWAKIAREGAAAAEKGDFKAAKATCKTCHKAWKDKYLESYKTRAVPKLPADADKGRKDIK
ncbi:MAG: hypothetical protein KC417_15565 [Myxococcales bacterium]|nr:hypothetical protein [Myxococcales bacterium]